MSAGPTLGAADRALVESFVHAAAGVLDRTLIALQAHDTNAHAATRRLLDAGGMLAASLTCAPSGFLLLRVELTTPAGEAMEVMQMDLTPPQAQPNAGNSLQ